MALAVTLMPGGAEGTGSTPAFQTLSLETLGGRSAAAAGEALLPERTTKPFSLLGVTWADPARTIAGAVRVRTRSRLTGRWSAWHTLESDGSAPGDARGATDPLWVGDSDGVQARVTGRDALPAGLRVDLINPDAPDGRAASGRQTPELRSVGGRRTPVAPEGRAASGRQTPELRSVGGRRTTVAPEGRAASGRQAPAGTRTGRSVPLPARPVPRMITRSGWGANETIVKSAPRYTGPTEVFFVHHTATGNGYDCSQSAAIVRGIQAYQVRSKGWDDIGYNFLVDKCGTIFEGRAGGAGRPVLGAHTLGFNTDASAIAVIGTFDSVRVSSAVETAIAEVAAFKLGAYGNDPAGRVLRVSGGGNLYPQGVTANLYRISGHRDAGRTDCPGDALYAQLPAIRAIAGAAPSGLRFLRMAGAVRSGTRLVTKGAIKPLWNVRTPSALIARFEIWVDGKLVLATPGGHRTALLHLPAGRHTVAVRALHLSGRARTITAEVVSRGA